MYLVLVIRCRIAKKLADLQLFLFQSQINNITMRLFTFLFLAAFVSFASAQDPNTYGEPLTEQQLINGDQFVSSIKENDEVNAKLEGTILKTCAMKGCWMTVRLDNGEEMRVTFKDYGFFVPKSGVEGNKVIFEGVGQVETIDVDTQKHYAEDAGATEEEIAEITEPKETYGFVATGVAITKE